MNKYHSDGTQLLWSPSSLELLANPFELVHNTLVPPARNFNVSTLFGTLWGWGRQLHDLHGIERAIARSVAAARAARLDDYPKPKPWLKGLTTDGLARALVWHDATRPEVPRLWAGARSMELELTVPLPMMYKGEPFMLRCLLDQVEDCEGIVVDVERKSRAGSLNADMKAKYVQSPQLRTQQYALDLWCEGRAVVDAPTPDGARIELEVLEQAVTMSTTTRHSVTPPPGDWVSQVCARLEFYLHLKESGLLTAEAWVEGRCPYWQRDFDNADMGALACATQQTRERYLKKALDDVG